MGGRVILVTGATGSIGAATARRFAAGGDTVVLLARDAAELSALGIVGAEHVVVDLADLDSVRTSAAEVLRKHPKIDVLVNNAAVMKTTRATTKAGLELMFATNHLGPFLLTNLLLDALKAGAPSRIINVTAPSTSKLNFDDLQGERKFGALGAFGASKMCNLLFTFDLAKRLEGAGVSVIAFHPGLVRSELLKETNAVMRTIARLVSKSPDAAAEAIVRAAAEAKNGTFVTIGKELKADAYAHDTAVQKRLWDVSTKLAAL